MRFFLIVFYVKNLRGFFYQVNFFFGFLKITKKGDFKLFVAGFDMYFLLQFFDVCLSLKFCCFHFLFLLWDFYFKQQKTGISFFAINNFFDLFLSDAKKMEGGLSMTDLFHQQEVAIDEDKLIYFFPRSPSGITLVLKKIYMSLLLTKKSKPCFFNIIMSFISFINSIITQVKTFLSFFFFKKKGCLPFCYHFF